MAGSGGGSHAGPVYLAGRARPFRPHGRPVSSRAGESPGPRAGTGEAGAAGPQCREEPSLKAALETTCPRDLIARGRGKEESPSLLTAFGMEFSARGRLERARERRLNLLLHFHQRLAA